MHAQWLQNDAGFEQSLAMAAPEILFLALMAYLEKRQQKIPPIYHDERYWNLMHSIHNAIRFVSPEGNLPLDLPTLDDLI
jgi:hypothetical protein